MSRKIIAAGNWKMNKTAKEAVEFVEALKGRVADADSEVVVGVPFVCLPGVIEAAKDQISRLLRKTCTGRKKVLLLEKWQVQCWPNLGLTMLSLVTPKEDSTSVRLTRQSIKKHMRHSNTV